MSRTAGMPSRNRLGSGQSRDAVAGKKFIKTASASQPFSEACHSQSAEVVLAHLGFAVTGLSATEAAKRLAADGPNELK